MTVDLTGPQTSPGLTAQIVRPSTPGPWPGVVVLQEAWGVDEVLLRQAAKLADLGYLAIVPDLYAGQGMVRCVRAVMRAVAERRGRPYADIEAARQWLLDSPDCTGTVGVIGFCMGGGFALVLATTGDYAAASVNYGALPDDLDILRGACPIVASYGMRDKAFAGAARTLGETLTDVGVPHDVKEYPAAGHAFLNDHPNGPAPLRPLMKIMGAGPEPESAQDAWRRIDRFFALHLRGHDAADHDEASSPRVEP